MATCQNDCDATPGPVKIQPKDYAYELLEDPQRTLTPPTTDGQTLGIRGSFEYFHYGCDGYKDVGWGCGYRTLQSAISWIIRRRGSSVAEDQYVPSIREIQKILISIGDKGPGFEGSRDWIGTLEEFYVIDVLYQLPCRILNVKDLGSPEVLAQIRSYFEKYQGFIAMGGLSDTASKAIIGYHSSAGSGQVYLLIVDPHCASVPSSRDQLIDQGYVRWMPVGDFPPGMYNLCLILQP